HQFPAEKHFAFSNSLYKQAKIEILPGKAIVQTKRISRKRICQHLPVLLIYYPVEICIYIFHITWHNLSSYRQYAVFDLFVVLEISVYLITIVRIQRNPYPDNSLHLV